MAKKNWENSDKQEMTLAEAKAYRASLAKPAEAAPLTEAQKRESFRLYWAQEKAKYGKSKDLEEVLWLHLKSTKQDEPSKFEAGIRHFGLQKIK